MQSLRDRRFFISVIILLIVHAAGLIGLHTAYAELFRSATPFNLLLSFILLLLNHKQFNGAFLLFLALTAVAGFFVEVIGVRTGLLFGSYFYHETLGIQWLGVPFVIAVNWLMLVYCAGIVSNKLNTNMIIKSLSGAALLVILDIAIEPVAKIYRFWEFENGAAPLQNYIAWLIVSFVLLMLFHSLKFSKDSRLAPALLSVQFVFFVLLYFL